jgi:hypothetical protein
VTEAGRRRTISTRLAAAAGVLVAAGIGAALLRVLPLWDVALTLAVLLLTAAVLTGFRAKPPLAAAPRSEGPAPDAPLMRGFPAQAMPPGDPFALPFAQFDGSFARARSAASSLAGTVRGTLARQPLALVAAALGAGFTLALFLPASRAETRLARRLYGRALGSRERKLHEWLAEGGEGAGATPSQATRAKRRRRVA